MDATAIFEQQQRIRGRAIARGYCLRHTIYLGVFFGISAYVYAAIAWHLPSAYVMGIVFGSVWTIVFYRFRTFIKLLLDSADPAPSMEG